MRRITVRDVALIARRFLRAYPAAAYHPTEKNCFTFVEEFLGRLRMGGTFGEFKVPSPQLRPSLPGDIGEGWESPDSLSLFPNGSLSDDEELEGAIGEGLGSARSVAEDQSGFSGELSLIHI